MPGSSGTHTLEELKCRKENFVPGTAGKKSFSERGGNNIYALIKRLIIKKI
jgi:hypothetical protein